MKIITTMLRYLAIILLFSSCVGQKGATNYFLNKHPEQLARLCADKFPIKETFKPGVPLIIRDTIKGDSVQCPPATINSAGQSVPGKVKCPDRTNEKTIIRDTIYQENTAKLRLLELEKNQEHDARTKAETSLKDLAKRYTWALYVIGFFTLIIFLLGILIIRK